MKREIKNAVLVVVFAGTWLHSDMVSADWSAEDRRQEKEQLDLWERRLANTESTDDAGRIGELALGLRSMAFRKGFGQRDSRTDTIFLEIQQAITKIPGHAEYYRDRILKAQENTRRIVGDPALSGPARADYDNELMYGFQTLPLMPSVETVRVLGEMLSNDWVPPGNETADIADKLTPLSRKSTAVLAKFPIVHKPFNEPLRAKNIDEALAAWRQWHDEIKSGRRTFRFEGDPTDYDLNGPAPKEKLERIALASRMDKDRAERHGGNAVASRAENPVSSKTPLVTLILAVVAVFSSLVWYFRREGVAKP